MARNCVYSHMNTSDFTARSSRGYSCPILFQGHCSHLKFAPSELFFNLSHTALTLQYFCFPFQVKQSLQKMGHLQPMNIFLKQEIDRMQRVIHLVRTTLVDLKLAIDGTIIMNEVKYHITKMVLCLNPNSLRVGAIMKEIPVQKMLWK